MKYTIKLKLSNLRDVFYENKEIDGNMEECIVIPIKKNCITKTKKGAIITLKMQELPQDRCYAYSHFLGVYMYGEAKDEARRLGYNFQLSTLGLASPFTPSSIRKPTPWISTKYAKPIEDVLDED